LFRRYHRTTLAQVTTAELNVRLEDSVSTKTSRRAFHKSNITIGLQLLNI
jgi:hypothetical protein